MAKGLQVDGEKKECYRKALISELNKNKEPNKKLEILLQ